LGTFGDCSLIFSHVLFYGYLALSSFAAFGGERGKGCFLGQTIQTSYGSSGGASVIFGYAAVGMAKIAYLFAIFVQ